MYWFCEQRNNQLETTVNCIFQLPVLVTRTTEQADRHGSQDRSPLRSCSARLATPPPRQSEVEHDGSARGVPRESHQEANRKSAGPNRTRECKGRRGVVHRTVRGPKGPRGVQGKFVCLYQTLTPVSERWRGRWCPSLRPRVYARPFALLPACRFPQIEVWCLSYLHRTNNCAPPPHFDPVTLCAALGSLAPRCAT